MLCDPQATPNATMENLDSDLSGRTVNSIVENVVSELHQGIRHGHFEITVSGARVSGYVQVIIKAAKNHRFLVPKRSTEK